MKTDRKSGLTVRQLAQCALVAALSYIGFQFLRVDIPVGTVKTAIHMGNVFVVLGALLLGFKGGAAGALGLTLADLTSGYVTYAPETFVLKLIMGTVTWLAASACRRGMQDDRKADAAADAQVNAQDRSARRNKLGEQGRLALISSAAALGANVVLDPLFGYIYQKYIFGIPQDLSAALAKISSLTTLFNTVVSVIIVTVLWPVLHKALARSGMI